MALAVCWRLRPRSSAGPAATWRRLARRLPPRQHRPPVQCTARRAAPPSPFPHPPASYIIMNVIPIRSPLPAVPRPPWPQVYHPCLLQTKKRYVGFSYESPTQASPTFDAKVRDGRLCWAHTVFTGPGSALRGRRPAVRPAYTPILPCDDARTQRVRRALRRCGATAARRWPSCWSRASGCCSGARTSAGCVCACGCVYEVWAWVACSPRWTKTLKLSLGRGPRASRLPWISASRQRLSEPLPAPSLSPSPAVPMC